MGSKGPKSSSLALLALSFAGALISLGSGPSGNTRATQCQVRYICATTTLWAVSDLACRFILSSDLSPESISCDLKSSKSLQVSQSAALNGTRYISSESKQIWMHSTVQHWLGFQEAP